MMYKSMAVIVIPVYKERLDIYEQVSLTQARRILEKYEVRFVAPQGMKLCYGTLGEDIKVEWFPAYFFQSKYTYSRLMLSTCFYERFINFEYMLIYQLDAFVFSDRLEEFCNLGYDYIGAPVSRSVSVWRPLKKRIGNGGFSLRKVKKCRDLCQRKDDIFALQPNLWKENQFILWEDVYFGFAGSLPNLGFQTPGYKVAQSFAVEHDGGRVYKKIRSGWRPFGCHAWGQSDYWFWKPLIEEFGYKLPDAQGTGKLSVRVNYLGNYAVRRILRSDKLPIVIGGLKDVEWVAIWGLGIQGRLCYELIKAIGLKIKCIFDNESKIDGISESVLRPTKEKLIEAGCPIIIATIRYETEMIDKLEELGMKRGEEYYLWRELKQDVLVGVCQRIIRDKD